jgi:MoaA/NifB/PqqE/SkfB family radical SAM enzyme
MAVQIPAQIPEEINQIFQNIKEFFKEKNRKIEINPELLKDDKGIKYLWVNFEKLEFTENEFQDFIAFLNDLGFDEFNVNQYKILDYIGYKEYEIYFELRHLSKNISIYLKYYKEILNSEILIYLDILVIIF